MGRRIDRRSAEVNGHGASIHGTRRYVHDIKIRTALEGRIPAGPQAAEEPEDAHWVCQDFGNKRQERLLRQGLRLDVPESEAEKSASCMQDVCMTNMSYLSCLRGNDFPNVAERHNSICIILNMELNTDQNEDSLE